MLSNRLCWCRHRRRRRRCCLCYIICFKKCVCICRENTFFRLYSRVYYRFVTLAQLKSHYVLTNGLIKKYKLLCFGC